MKLRKAEIMTEVISSSSVKNPGWFSRKYKTREGLDQYRASQEDKEADWLATMDENRAARNKRTPTQQLARLDKILGKGVGAKKERARLFLKIAQAKPKPKKD